MAKELNGCQWEHVPKKQLNAVISTVAQLVASIPDKAQPRAMSTLSAQYPFCFCCRIYVSFDLCLSVPCSVHLDTFILFKGYRYA